MGNVINNPIALLFLSFAFGAIMHTVLARQKWYQQYYNLNFLNDRATKFWGVLIIEWIIINSPLRVFNPKLKIEGRPTKEDLVQLRNVMTAAELSHLFGFVALVPINVYYIIYGKSIYLILGLFFLNWCFNLYPALTQQYNKRRLDRILNRK